MIPNLTKESNKKQGKGNNVSQQPYIIFFTSIYAWETGQESPNLGITTG